METIWTRLEEVERKVQEHQAWSQIQQALFQEGPLTSIQWRKTPSTYYEWTLQQRAEVRPRN